jgi:hypothetical protein
VLLCFDALRPPITQVLLPALDVAKPGALFSSVTTAVSETVSSLSGSAFHDSGLGRLFVRAMLYCRSCGKISLKHARCCYFMNEQEFFLLLRTIVMAWLASPKGVWLQKLVVGARDHAFLLLASESDHNSADWVSYPRFTCQVQVCHHHHELE